MDIDVLSAELLPKLKVNLVIGTDDTSEDDFLSDLIHAGIDYSQRYQNKDYTLDDYTEMPNATKQAVLMLATHFYESRDLATGGYFNDTALAGSNARSAIDRLLSMHKDWQV